MKKGILRNFTKFTGKYLFQSLFFNRQPEACNFIQKETLAQVFPRKFLKNSMYSSDIAVYISGHHVVRVELKPNQNTYDPFNILLQCQIKIFFYFYIMTVSHLLVIESDNKLFMSNYKSFIY